MFAWSRNFYAKRNGKYICFEAKRNRDDAVKNWGYEKVSAKEAYKHYPHIRISWREWEQ